MGELLVADMSTEWNPQVFKDSFKKQILGLVDKKIKAGQTESVTPIEAQETTTGPSATIYDLTELLQRSLNKGSKAENPAEKPAPAEKATRPKAKPAAKSSTKPPAKKKAA